MNGDIGKYNLGDFWHRELTERDRTIIRDVFGRVDEKAYSEDACGGLLLFNIASRCIDFDYARSTGRTVARYAMRTVREYPEYTFTVLHYSYTATIRLYWADRHTFDDAISQMLSFCNMHVMAEPHIRPGLRRENPSLVLLPPFAGFQYQAMYHEEVGEYDAARAWAKKGKHRGWTGEWDAMLERLA